MFKPAFSILTAAALTAFAGTASAIDFNGAFAETFDELGTTGTTLPSGFAFYNGETGTTNTTWSAATGIIANGTTGSVASMVLNTNPLTATTTPSGNNNNGFNAATSSGNPGDRVVATGPTQVSGSAIQLQLTNTTAMAINSLTLGYTIQRFTAVSTANELPGYQVFVSLDGTTWTNIAQYNPTIDGAGGTIAVPNSVGSTVVSPTTFVLPSALAVGGTMNLRWVDDNAVQTSPDQIVGLNNITVSVPEPSTAAASIFFCAAGAMLLLRRKGNRKAPLR